jgi:hypothetical protein
MEAMIMENLRSNNIPKSLASIVTSYYSGFQELVLELILQLNAVHAEVHVVYCFKSDLDLNTEPIAFEGFSFLVPQNNCWEWIERKLELLNSDIRLFSDKFGHCSFQELCGTFDGYQPSGNLEFDIHTFPDGAWYYCDSCPKCQYKLI